MLAIDQQVLSANINEESQGISSCVTLGDQPITRILIQFRRHWIAKTHRSRVQFERWREIVDRFCPRRRLPRQFLWCVSRRGARRKMTSRLICGTYCARGASRRACWKQSFPMACVERQVGPDGYAKGRRRGRRGRPRSRRAMTNDKPVKNRGSAVAMRGKTGSGHRVSVGKGLRPPFPPTYPMLFKLCGLPAR